MDTLTRTDVDSKGSKTEIVPLRHPPRTQLPNVLLLEPLANESDPIDIESDDDTDDNEFGTGPAPSQVSILIYALPSSQIPFRRGLLSMTS